MRVWLRLTHLFGLPEGQHAEDLMQAALGPVLRAAWQDIVDAPLPEPITRRAQELAQREWPTQSLEGPRRLTPTRRLKPHGRPRRLWARLIWRPLISSGRSRRARLHCARARYKPPLPLGERADPITAHRGSGFSRSRRVDTDAYCASSRGRKGAQERRCTRAIKASLGTEPQSASPHRTRRGSSSRRCGSGSCVGRPWPAPSMVLGLVRTSPARRVRKSHRSGRNPSAG
jgi:hypothetical protein